MPAAEGLDTVKTVIEEASTSMQEKSGSAAGLDVGSLSFQQTPIQSEVIIIFNGLLVHLAFISESNADPPSFCFLGLSYL